MNKTITQSLEQYALKLLGRDARRLYILRWYLIQLINQAPPEGVSEYLHTVSAEIHIMDILSGVHNPENPKQWECAALSKIVTTRKNRRSIPGYCQYDVLLDPARDRCLHCGEPYERK